MAKELTGYQKGWRTGFGRGLEYAALYGIPQKIIDSAAHMKVSTQTISKKAAEAIISYEKVVGFDPETGEAIWETVEDG